MPASRNPAGGTPGRVPDTMTSCQRQTAGNHLQQFAGRSAIDLSDQLPSYPSGNRRRVSRQSQSRLGLRPDDPVRLEAVIGLEIDYHRLCNGSEVAVGKEVETTVYQSFL